MYLTYNLYKPIYDKSEYSVFKVAFILLNKSGFIFV